jgi:hypothetical protein
MPRQPILRASNEAGESYDDPSEDVLFELLRELGEDNSFLIVDRLDRPDSFMQTVRDGSGTFVVEYREGSKESHYATTIDSMRETHKVMTAWASELPGWKENRA